MTEKTTTLRHFEEWLVALGKIQAVNQQHASAMDGVPLTRKSKGIAEKIEKYRLSEGEIAMIFKGPRNAD